MIESGTHAPGVPASVFDLQAHTALRYERPDASVSDYVTDYYVLDSEGPEAMGAVEWSMPGSANIRFFLGERSIDVTIGKQVFAPTPHAALYGPTSRAPRVCSYGGVTIGMGISALGWSRLFRQRAERFRDRIVPLAEAFPGAPAAAALFAELRASDQGPAVKGILDAFFAEHLGPSNPEEPLIRRIMGLITDETIGDIAEISERLSLTPQQLRSLSLRYFGFPPKRMLRRARFLRSLLRMYAVGEPDYSLIAASYFDVSHFLRDSEEFLGMTPKRFMAQQTPYLRNVLRVRTAVLGTPAQALHVLEA